MKKRFFTLLALVALFTGTSVHAQVRQTKLFIDDGSSKIMILTAASQTTGAATVIIPDLATSNGTMMTTVTGGTVTTNGVTYAVSGVQFGTTAAGTNNTFLRGNTGSAPSFAAVNLGTADVTGTLPATKGGTGLASYTAGDLLYANSTTTLTTIAAAGNDGKVLELVSGVPTWTTVSGTGTVTSVAVGTGATGLTLTTDVTAGSPDPGGVDPITDAGTIKVAGGTLVVSHGGTGATSLTSHGVVYGNGTSAVGVTAEGATNTVLHGNTGGAPTYSAVDLASADVTGTLPPTKGGTGQSTYTTGDILYSDAFNSLAKLPVSGSPEGAVLTLTSGVPAWSNPASSTLTTNTIVLGGSGSPATNVVLYIQDGHIQTHQTTDPVLSEDDNAHFTSSDLEAGSTDVAGVISIVSADDSGDPDAFVTLTYDGAYTHPVVVFSATNQIAAGNLGAIFIDSQTSHFDLHFNPSAFLGETVGNRTLKFTYHVIEAN